MTGPRVLALDLSLTATGVAHPAGELATIRTSPQDGDRRLAVIRDNVRAVLAVARPTLVAIEDLPKHAKAAGLTGMVQGVVRVEVLDHGIPYITPTAATLKTYALGKGSGPETGKPDMRMALYKRTGHDEPDDNKVDAAWLRYLALDLLGAPELDLPQTHRRALDKLTLPDGVVPIDLENP